MYSNDILLEGTYSALPLLVMRSTLLTPADKLVYAAMLRHLGTEQSDKDNKTDPKDRGKVWPGADRIAGLTGLGLRTVKLSRQRLVTHGLLTNHGTGFGMSSRYTFNDLAKATLDRTTKRTRKPTKKTSEIVQSLHHGAEAAPLRDSAKPAPSIVQSLHPHSAKPAPSIVQKLHVNDSKELRHLTTPRTTPRKAPEGGPATQVEQVETTVIEEIIEVTQPEIIEIITTTESTASTQPENHEDDPATLADQMIQQAKRTGLEMPGNDDCLQFCRRVLIDSITDNPILAYPHCNPWAIITGHLVTMKGFNSKSLKWLCSHKTEDDGTRLINWQRVANWLYSADTTTFNQTIRVYLNEQNLKWSDYYYPSLEALLGREVSKPKESPCDPFWKEDLRKYAGPDRFGKPCFIMRTEKAKDGEFHYIQFLDKEVWRVPVTEVIGEHDPLPPAPKPDDVATPQEDDDLARLLEVEEAEAV